VSKACAAGGAVRSAESTLPSRGSRPRVLGSTGLGAESDSRVVWSYVRDECSKDLGVLSEPLKAGSIAVDEYS
jgi:hypothetical protein